ncbi:MAG: hypothetical protein VYB54_07135 [Pseudomonadota bacterium]|nr:hypothetical protein [Pseudomonadota bacterium]
MEDLLGTSPGVFIGLTCVLAGGAAWMTGQALAANWLPRWQGVAYGILLAAANRFLVYALFDGQLLSVPGFLVACVVLVGIVQVAFQATRAFRMVSQYPWLYEPAGPFSWRERKSS